MNEKERNIALEWELNRMKEDMAKLVHRVEKAETTITRWDRMGLKVSTVVATLLFIGTVIGMGVDRAKEKLLNWLLP